MKQQEETGKAEEDCVEECKSRIKPERCGTAEGVQNSPTTYTDNFQSST